VLHAVASLSNIAEANFTPARGGEPLQAPVSRDSGPERRETVPAPFFLFFHLGGAAPPHA